VRARGCFDTNLIVTELLVAALSRYRIVIVIY